MTDPEDAPTADDTEALALEFLRRLESDGVDARDELRERLPASRRPEFDALLDALGTSRRVFPSRLQPGRLIGGDLELVEEIGAGGFGKVWRVHDQSLRRDVAVKFFDSVTAREDETRLQHAVEGQALARIEHPGVVKIHRTGRDGDLLYLVMELVRGVSLDRIVAELAGPAGPPTIPRLRALLGEARLAGLSNLLPTDDEAPWWVAVARITAAILQILEAVHERGVLHRDLKPSNVMLRASGHPVLLDFGMASFRDQEGSQLTSRLYGTLQYLAPEQLRDSRTGKDERTDVYQVGAILYEFLTLRRACDDVDALRSHRFPDRGRDAPPVPATLEEVCLHALAQEPAARYPTAQAFREALEACVRDRLPSAPRPGPTALPDRFDVRKTLLDSPRTLRRLAWDRRLDREVVLESPGPGLRALRAGSRATSALALREAQALARVRHPQVVRLLEVFEVPGSVVMVLEPWRGQSLEELLAREGTLSVDAVIDLGVALADAAAAAHEAEVLHRAIEAGTVWIDPEAGTPVLGGFTFAKQEGIANSLGARQRTSADDAVVAALPPHLAPEQLAGAREDARSDVYALGCLLFHALTGSRPQALEGGEVSDPRAMRRDCPRGLADVLARAMARPPQARFATMHEFREALAASRKRGWLRSFLERKNGSGRR